MRAKFIGDPATGEGPKVVTTLGHTFRKDEWKPIPEPVHTKLSGNSHFKTDLEGEAYQAPPPVDPSDLEEIEKIAILAELETLGAEKPHHKTGLPRLRELLAEVRAKAEDEAFMSDDD
jgi:hypothetical protein